jgi:SulP family sulfate permease
MDIRHYVPILEWLPNYKKKDLRGDLLAGLTVGVMLVPQGMAYGLLAGLPPIYGLYAGLIPLFFYAFFGTSRQLSVGPTALVSLLILAGVGEFAEPGTETFIALAISTALIAGIIQIILGAFKLGWLVNFLSHPVIAGFTSAAALIIGFSQLKNLLGIDIPRSNYIHEIILHAIQEIGNMHWGTFALGLGGIIFIRVLRRIKRSIPGALLAVLFGTLIVWGFQLNQMGVAVVGEVPSGLPSFELPQFDLATIQQLLPLGMTICIISFIESLAIAKTIEAKHKSYRVIPNQELLALGLTKIGSAFFQSFPTTGSFTRSAINNEAGARTGLSSMISAVLIGLTLIFLTPMFYFLPKAILAAIVVAAVLGLIDYKEAIRLWSNDRRDFYMMLTTFLATLALGIQLGVLVGVVLSLILMVYQNSRPHISVLGQLPGTRDYRNIDRFPEAQQPSNVLLVRFDAQLYFGNASYFKDKIENILFEHPGKYRYLVLDASNIHDIDSSGMHALEEFIEYMRRHEVEFILANAIGPVRDQMAKCGLMAEIGPDKQFLNVHDALAAIQDQTPKSQMELWKEAATQTNISDSRSKDKWPPSLPRK